jgi:alpha-D-ribose 1-methylphosphonate 5-triphosphate diphosphatase
MNETVIYNAQVVLRDRVTSGIVMFDEGGIVDITEDVADLDSSLFVEAGSVSIDAKGAYLLPGLIEIHTDALEWHLRPRPQSLWPAAAAVVGHDAVLAASGITTVLDSLCIGDLGGDGFRADVLLSALEAIELGQRAGAFRSDHFLHLRCEVADPRTPELFDREVTRNMVRLVSLMDHTPGVRQYRDMDVYRGAMMADDASSGSAAAFDRMNSRIAMLQARRAEFSLPNWKHIAAVACDMGIALASHDDATAEDIALAVASGVSISEFPTTLEAASAAHQAGLLTAAGAPNVVRGGSHSGNVRAADLAGHGVLDMLTSDYVPYSLLHAPFLLAEQGVVALHEAIDMVTGAPAAAVGLNDRGSLEAGKRADLAMVRLAGGVPSVLGVWSAGRRVS